MIWNYLYVPRVALIVNGRKKSTKETVGGEWIIRPKVTKINLRKNPQIICVKNVEGLLNYCLKARNACQKEV